MNSKSLGENEYKSDISVALASAVEYSESSGTDCDLEFVTETASRYR